MIARCTLLFLFAALSGCALTVSGAVAGAVNGQPSVPVLSAGVSSHAFRQNAPVFGFRLSSRIAEGLHLRSGLLHGGYDLRVVPGRFAIEPGLDLGAGSPLTQSSGGLSAYGGVGLNFRLRIYGADDSEPAYLVAATALELVLITRLGAWMPPESAHSRALVTELAGEVGLRFAFGTDIVAAAQGEIVDTRSRIDAGAAP